MKRPAWLLTGALVLGMGLAGCAGARIQPATAQGSGTAQSAVPASAGTVATDNQGGIEVRVSFDPSGLARPDGELVFRVDLDNHSVDLSNLNLASGAMLVPSPGHPVTTGFRWKQEGSGHHATGVLSLPNKDEKDEPIVTASTKALTLELRDLGGVSVRTFKFTGQGWKVSG